MRLVLIGPARPLRGGVAQHTTRLAAAAEAAGHDVLLLSYARLYPRWLYPGRAMREPDDAGAAVGRPVLIPWWPPTWRAAARAALAHGPDLVVIQWWVPFLGPMAAWLAWRLARGGARVAWLCHNVLPHEGGGPVDRAVIRAALGRGDAWLVHSRSDADALAALLGPARLARGRLAVTAMPAVAPEAAQPPPDRAAARRALGVPGGAPLALFFGFVRPYKGLDVLIDALPAARAAVPGLRLWVAGECWTPARDLAAQAHALGLGAAEVTIEDAYLPAAEAGIRFAAADVCVLPYRSATQSAVATAAFAHGLPVIASRVGGLPDAVADGVDGLLVPPGDPAALAAAIARFFTEPGLAAHLAAGAAARGAQLGWAPMVAVIEGLARVGDDPGPQRDRWAAGRSSG